MNGNTSTESLKKIFQNRDKNAVYTKKAAGNKSDCP